MEPRAYTAEEVREQLLAHLREVAHYWSRVPDQTPREMCDGVVFSVLNIFDGTTVGLPAMDILLSPHPDDKEFRISEGDNWYEDRQHINDCYLHELY